MQAGGEAGQRVDFGGSWGSFCGVELTHFPGVRFESAPVRAGLGKGIGLAGTRSWGFQKGLRTQVCRGPAWGTPTPLPRTQPLARHSALLFQRCVRLCLRAPETPCATPTGVVAKVRTGWGGQSLVGWQRQPGQSRAAPGTGARLTSCSRSLWALSGCANGRAPAPLFLVELRGAFGQDGASSEMAPGGLFLTVCLRVDVGIPQGLGGGMPGSSLEWHTDASVPLRAQPDRVV